MLIWLHSAQGSIWNRRLQIAVLWPVARCLVVEWEQQQDVALVHLELMQPCDPCLHWRRTSRGSCFIADYCSKLVEELFGYLQILCYCRVFWIIKRVVLKNCFVIFNHLSWMMLDDVNSVWIETMFQFINSVWILFWWKCYYQCHCMVLHPLSFAVFIHQWMSFIIICLSSGFLKHHCHCVGNY
jgi:hypothetical protein